MNATRPRHSILHLFDPLTSSQDSEKENLLTIDNCFPTFGAHIYKQPSPHVPRRRLIDIGDITIDDPSTLIMLTEEEGPEDVDSDENTCILRTSPSTPVGLTTAERTYFNSRTPLGEIAIESDITPIARTKSYKRPPPPSPSFPTEPMFVTPMKDIQTISIRNAVNVSAVLSTHQGLSGNPHDLDHLALEQDTNHAGDIKSVAPLITVSPPSLSPDLMSPPHVDATLLPDDPHFFGTTSTSAPPEISPSHSYPRLRPNLPNISHEPNRYSIDLHTSFQLQLQSEDASFDLLNDKITLFTSSGMDSFFNAMDGDNSFDTTAEEANKESALEKLQLVNATKDKGISHHPVTHEEVAKEIELDTKTPEAQKAITPKISATIHGEPKSSLPKKRLSLGFKTNSPESATSISVKTLPIFIPPSSGSTYIPSASAHTPAPSRSVSTVAQAAVPALRIVKRTKRFDHEKSSTSGSGTDVSTMPKNISAVTGGTQTSRVQQSIPVSVEREARPIMGQAPVSTTGPRRVTAASEPIVPSSKINTAARRVLAVEPSIMGKSRGSENVPSTAMIGPRRVLAAPSSSKPGTITMPSKAPTISGLKPPVKYRAGLPRPVVISKIAAPVVGELKPGGGAQGRTRSVNASRRVV